MLGQNITQSDVSTTTKKTSAAFCCEYVFILNGLGIKDNGSWGKNPNVSVSESKCRANLVYI